MNELRKFVAPELVFGTGACELAGQYASGFAARRVLVVTDPGVMVAGWTDPVIESLGKHDIEAILFSDVSPNPRGYEVMAGADVYRTKNCDAIVTVGGGSPMDCAKAIGIVCTNNTSVLSFEGIDKVNIPGPPLICIPTTAGTSADVSQFSIITNSDHHVKIAIISKTVVPDVALIDPRTTITMNANLTACTGIDALVHAIEAYVSTANHPIMDLHAKEAISLIKDSLLGAIRDGSNLELRTKMMRGSLEAGLAFSNASLGAVHAMAHSLGGLLDLPHGECNSLLLSHVIAFNFSAAADRYRTVAELMGIATDRMTNSEVRKALVESIKHFKQEAGITEGLSSRGVKTADIQSLAEKALQDPCMVTNPRIPCQRDIEVVYEEAL